jgi:hypothetical protein
MLPCASAKIPLIGGLSDLLALFFFSSSPEATEGLGGAVIAASTSVAGVNVVVVPSLCHTRHCVPMGILLERKWYLRMEKGNVCSEAGGDPDSIFNVRQVRECLLKLDTGFAVWLTICPHVVRIELRNVHGEAWQLKKWACIQVDYTEGYTKGDSRLKSRAETDFYVSDIGRRNLGRNNAVVDALNCRVLQLSKVKANAGVRDLITVRCQFTVL